MGFLILVATLLAMLAPPVLAALPNNGGKWCSSYQLPSGAPGQCPPCRGGNDRCKPLDRYGESKSVCVLPQQVKDDMTLCGEPQTHPLHTLNGTHVGDVTVFQTSSFKLFVTIQLFCPYILRSEEGVEWFSSLLHIGDYYTLTFADENFEEDPSNADRIYNFVDYFPLDGTAASFSCLTYAVDLRKTCDHGCSTYTHNPLAEFNEGCELRPNEMTKCQPLDLTIAYDGVPPVVAIVPVVQVAMVDSTCKDVEYQKARVRREMTRLDTVYTGSIIKWSVGMCKFTPESGRLPSPPLSPLPPVNGSPLRPPPDNVDFSAPPPQGSIMNPAPADKSSIGGGENKVLSTGLLIGVAAAASVALIAAALSVVAMVRRRRSRTMRRSSNGDAPGSGGGGPLQGNPVGSPIHTRRSLEPVLERASITSSDSGSLGSITIIAEPSMGGICGVGGLAGVPSGCSKAGGKGGSSTAKKGAQLQQQLLAHAGPPSAPVTSPPVPPPLLQQLQREGSGAMEAGRQRTASYTTMLAVPGPVAPAPQQQQQRQIPAQRAGSVNSLPLSHSPQQHLQQQLQHQQLRTAPWPGAAPPGTTAPLTEAQLLKQQQAMILPAVTAQIAATSHHGRSGSHGGGPIRSGMSRSGSQQTLVQLSASAHGGPGGGRQGSAGGASRGESNGGSPDSNSAQAQRGQPLQRPQAVAVYGAGEAAAGRLQQQQWHGSGGATEPGASDLPSPFENAMHAVAAYVAATSTPGTGPSLPPGPGDGGVAAALAVAQQQQQQVLGPAPVPRAFLDLGSINEFCSTGSVGSTGSVVRHQHQQAVAAAARAQQQPPQPPQQLPAELAAVVRAVSGLTPGALVANKYKIKAPPILGRHSVVLLAKNVYSGHRVAIKFYAREEHWEREGTVLRGLNSKFVPSLEESIPAGEGIPPALVLEAGHSTLCEWLRSHRPDPAQQRAALQQVLAALVHLHQHRVVHRDVRPANVMWFEEAQRFKLIDLAECSNSGAAAPPACSPLYSAPELLKAVVEGAPEVAVQCSCDMYSFGVLAYEVLTGARFYGPNATTRDALERAFGHKPLSTEQEDSPLSGTDMPALELVVNTAQRSPAKRWTAAAAVRSSLFAHTSIAGPAMMMMAMGLGGDGGAAGGTRR